MMNPTTMPATAAVTAVRSSLEEMLDSLRRRDEKPKDVPPELPRRPPSRGRLPSARKFPANFKDGNAFLGTLPLIQEKEREEKTAVLNSGILGKKRKEKDEKQEESPYVDLPELESYEERSEEVDDSQSPPPLSNSSVNFSENLRSEETIDSVIRKIDVLEKARKNTIVRVVWVQKQYRCVRALRHFQKLKQAAIILQSLVRGYLTRKNFINLQSEKLHHEKKNGCVAHKDLQGRKDLPEVQALALALAEVQKRALQAEVALRQKEDECAALTEKLRLHDVKWSENEIKVKAKEELWQKQMTSLLMNLEASRTTQTCATPDISPLHHNHHNYDFDDGNCMMVHTPEATPPRQLTVSIASSTRDYDRNRDAVGLLTSQLAVGIRTMMHTPQATPPRQGIVSAATPTRDYDRNCDAVGLLNREMEQRMQDFEEDAQNISQLNPEEDLRKLKSRFYAWKKDFKARIREKKVALRKSGVSEGDKSRKRWWVKRAMRI